jgi:putative membrane protein
MKSNRKLRLTVYLLGFAGAALFTALLVRQGVSSVASVVAAAGWAIAAIAVFHFLPIYLDAISWWVLFPKNGRPSARGLFWMRWVGESISNLVPSTAVGGDIVRARLATITGAPIAMSAATVIVDVTLGIVTQITFTLLGLMLLVRATGQSGLVGPTLVGAMIGVAAALGFYFVQRLGLFRLVSLMIARLLKSPEWRSLVQSGEVLDQTVRAQYQRRSGVVACCGWTLLSLIVSSGEIWIALYAVRAPQPTFANALILQSMAMTVKSAAFPVPGGLGVQESGYLLIGNILGIPGQTALAIALIARFRDLAVGIPGLVVWQIIEGRRFLHNRPPSSGR